MAQGSESFGFVIDPTISPDVAPLAWLVGTWEGEGELGYPGIEPSRFTQTVHIGHDGGPYLTHASEIRLLDEDGPGQVWASESGYWRVPPQEALQNIPKPGETRQVEVEFLLAEPSGHVSVYMGVANGPRIDLATDLIARTDSGAEVEAATRLYGLVQGQLMWAHDMAAFGESLQSYASAQLQRKG